MNARVSRTAPKLKWLVPLAVLILLVGVACASDRLLIPEDMAMPFYALGLGHSGESAGDWVVTAFCYPPDSFKANYDLFNQPVAPSMLPDQPCYMEGSATFADGLYPIKSLFTNVPGVKVPIWFTPVLAWNDKWTVAEMRKQGALRGWADFFQDIEQPVDALDPTSPVHGNTVATGVLEDGRSFYVHSETVYIKDGSKDVQYNVTVWFGD
jgi:hypothetical protein